MTIHALQTISIAMILIISTLMNVSITYNNDIESFSFHLLPPFLNSRTVFWTLMGKNKRSNTAKVLEGVFWWEQCWVKQLIIIIVKLLDSKINYQQHFELIYIYLKENVNIKVMKVSFKIIKHPRTSLRYMYIVMLNEIGAILLIHSFFFYTLLKIFVLKTLAKMSHHKRSFYNQCKVSSKWVKMLLPAAVSKGKG